MSTRLADGDLKTATYDFGEVPISFTSTDGPWLDQLERRYLPFRRSEAPKDAFRLRFEPEGVVPEELPSPLAAHLESVELEPTPRGFRAWTKTSKAEVYLDAGEALLRGPRAMYPLDNLLIQLLPLLADSSLLLHAAALAPGGLGVLAGGPSGAGKSTLASLVDDAALCDEVAAVRPEPQGFRLVSLPFWQARPASVPLAAVLLLVHRDDHALRPLNRGEAVRRLSQLVLWPTASAIAMERALSSLASIVESVPVYELGFAPRGDVLGFLRKELS